MELLWSETLTFLEAETWILMRRVSKTMKALLSRENVVRSLGTASSVKLILQGRTRSSQRDPFVVLIDGILRQRRSTRLACDGAAWKLWLKFHSRDHQALLRRKLTDLPSLPRHRLTFYADRTLAMLAAWRGRLKCLKLLHSHGADLNAEDANGFTVLMFAAFFNHLPCVKYLLRNGVDLQRQGEPPVNSSCGGHGSKTALEWAHRKNFTDIVNALQNASPSSSSESSEDDV